MYNVHASYFKTANIGNESLPQTTNSDYVILILLQPNVARAAVVHLNLRTSTSLYCIAQTLDRTS